MSCFGSGDEPSAGFSPQSPLSYTWLCARIIVTRTSSPLGVGTCWGVCRVCVGAGIRRGFHWGMLRGMRRGMGRGMRRRGAFGPHVCYLLPFLLPCAFLPPNSLPFPFSVVRAAYRGMRLGMRRGVRPGMLRGVRSRYASGYASHQGSK